MQVIIIIIIPSTNIITAKTPQQKVNVNVSNLISSTQSNQQMLYEKTCITTWMTARHHGQLASMSATRHAQYSQNLVRPHGTKVKPLIGVNKLHSTVAVRLQQLALLEPVCQFSVSHFQYHCTVLQFPLL